MKYVVSVTFEVEADDRDSAIDLVNEANQNHPNHIRIVGMGNPRRCPPITFAPEKPTAGFTADFIKRHA
jgi:hypothetical protein